MSEVIETVGLAETLSTPIRELFRAHAKVETFDLATGDTDAVDCVAVATIADLETLVHHEVDLPAILVGDGPIPPAVSTMRLKETIELLLAGVWVEHDWDGLSASYRDRSIPRALSDVSVMASEPARISEFDLDHPEISVGPFRADGIVIATPTGSRRYARSAGGPILTGDIDGVAVIPVGPFSIRHDQWVLSPEKFSVMVSRDESDVSMQIDGVTWGPIEPGDPVTLEQTPVITLMEPPAGEYDGSQ